MASKDYQDLSFLPLSTVRGTVPRLLKLYVLQAPATCCALCANIGETKKTNRSPSPQGHALANKGQETVKLLNAIATLSPLDGFLRENGHWTF